MTTVDWTSRVPQVSARVAGIEPILHGGASAGDLKRHGINPDALIDLSTNVHPYGPPESVGAMIGRVALDRYPDASAARMRHAIALQLHVEADQVVAGNGSVELIYLLAQVYLDPGDRALIVGPTFGEYASAIKLAGGNVVEYRAEVQHGFVPDIFAIIQGIGLTRPKLIFCCNPNNPTGQVLSKAAIIALADAASAAGGMLVVDEAYRALADDGTLPFDSVDLIHHHPIVLLRSLTKDYALPGLRLGYAIAPVDVGRILNTLRLPWAVNSFAEEVGSRLLEETGYLARCRARLACEKEYLIRRLSGISACYVSSAANYILVNIGAQGGSATQCRDALLHHGILVRDCTSFGLPDYIRVAVHSQEAADRLIEGLVEWQKAGYPNSSLAA